MRVAAILLLLLSAGLLQTTVVPRLAIAGVTPDLMLASVVYVALFFGPRYGLWAGFCGGMFMDLYSPRHLGANALIGTAIGFLLGSAGERIFRDKALTQFLTLVAAAVVHDLLYTLISGHPLELLSRLLPRSIYTGVLGFFSLQVVRRVKVRK